MRVHLTAAFVGVATLACSADDTSPESPEEETTATSSEGEAGGTGSSSSEPQPTDDDGAASSSGGDAEEHGSDGSDGSDGDYDVIGELSLFLDVSVEETSLTLSFVTDAPPPEYAEFGDCMVGELYNFDPVTRNGYSILTTDIWGAIRVSDPETTIESSEETDFFSRTLEFDPAPARTFTFEFSTTELGSALDGTFEVVSGSLIALDDPTISDLDPGQDTLVTWTNGSDDDHVILGISLPGPGNPPESIICVVAATAGGVAIPSAAWTELFAQIEMDAVPSVDVDVSQLSSMPRMAVTTNLDSEHPTFLEAEVIRRLVLTEVPLPQ